MIIVGNSHTISLNIEFLEHKTLYENINHVEYVKTYFDDLVKSNDDFKIENIIQQELAKNGKQSLILIFGGEFYNILSTQLNEHIEFDFFLPTQKKIRDVNLNLIPYKLLYTFCMSRLKKLQDSIKKLKKLNLHEIYLCLPIYPSRRELLEETANQKLLIENDDIKSVNILRDYIRIKLWNLNRIVLEDLCRICEINFLLPPENTCNKDMLLYRNLSHDGVHGNRKFAKLLLTNLNKLQKH